MTFKDFGFDEKIQKGIDEAGFENPMPVQAQCFELLIKQHRDVYAQSQTGTGKTAAFLLGIFQLLETEEAYKGQKAIIIVPTRELAVQIEREAGKLARFLDYRIGAVFGGVGYGSQEKMLEEGVDILIGTPGRLIDFGKQKKLNLRSFGFLVIDEADRLFDMGFLPDLRRILKGMKPYNERHTLLFSATMNARVGNLAWEYMNDPGEVIIEPEKVTVDTVSQELYHVGKDEKMKLLLGILKRDTPENAVIFTNTRHSAWEVAKRLEVNGYSVVFLMGDLPQSRRLRIVDEVKKGKHKFLVATDVAARGLHIDDLEMVINYDVPLEAESYVHRIGRTARAGREGKTVTLACEEYVYGLSPIETLLGQKLPVSWAEEGLLVEDASRGMRFPPQERYSELGDNRGGRRDGHQGGSRSRGDRDDRRGSRNRSRGGNNKGPSHGKRPLDPRAARIQSSISSIAGGSLDELSADAQAHHDRRADARSDKRRGGNQQRKGRWDVPQRPETPMREDERISSDSSIDERLAYYRKKYGEDFQLKEGGSSRSSSKRGNKKKSGDRSRRDQQNQDSGKPASRGGNAPQKQQQVPAGKKGFFSKFFGKK